MTINQDVLDSTSESALYIKYGDKTASAFVIKFDGENYLITAGHVVNGINQNDEISVYIGKHWRPYNVSLVHCGDLKNFDIGIMRISDWNLPILGSDFKNDFEPVELSVTEKVYFFGFPLGLLEKFPNTLVLESERSELPSPFVKEGIISNFGYYNDELSHIYLDAHVNPGFSGGPAYVLQDGKLVLLGLMSCFIKEQLDPQNIYNSGIAVCVLFSTVLWVLESVIQKKSHSFGE